MQDNPPAAAVCVYSFHPLVVAQFERLCQNHLDLTAVRLDPAQGAAPRNLPVPAARAYVVEANVRRRTACAIVEAVLTRRPHARVLVIGEAFEEKYAFLLLRLGVKGLLCYSEVRELFVRALNEMMAGGFWVPRSMLSRFVEDSVSSLRPPRRMGTIHRLSPREREVHELLIENLSNKEIAGRLNMSERTVKFHVSNLLCKHGVKRRADLILLSLTERQPAQVS